MTDERQNERSSRLPFLLAVTALGAALGLTLGVYAGLTSEPRTDWPPWLLDALFIFGPLLLFGLVLAAGRDGAARWAGGVFCAAWVVYWVSHESHPVFWTGYDDRMFPYLQAAALVGAATGVVRMLWSRVTVIACLLGAAVFMLSGPHTLFVMRVSGLF